MILCYDTTNKGASLLIADASGTVLKTANYDEARHFSLPDALIALWDEVNIAPIQTTRMVITLGPGSYTGIRAGLAVLEAYRLVLPKMQIFGISNMAVLAWLARCEEADFECYGIIGETRRKDYFFQCYDRVGIALNQACCASGDEIVEAVGKANNMLLYGTAADRFAADYQTPHQTIQQTFTAEQLLAYHLANPDEGKNQRTPLYLKPPDVTPRKVIG